MDQDQQSRLKELIAKGKEQGFLTYTEVNYHLPDGIVEPEQCKHMVDRYRSSIEQGVVEARPVLLVAYDYPAPDPLAASVGAYLPFAVAMVLTPDATPQSTRLGIETVSQQPVQGMHCGELERLRVSNPAACGLPLLRVLASGASGRVLLPHVNGLQLAVNVETG